MGQITRSSHDLLSLPKLILHVENGDYPHTIYPNTFQLPRKLQVFIVSSCKKLPAKSASYALMQFLRKYPLGGNVGVYFKINFQTVLG